MTKNILIGVATAVILAVLSFAVNTGLYAAQAWGDNRYVIAAESLFTYAQKLRREIYNEKHKPNPDQSEIEFLELQLQETEAELKKREG